MRLIKYILAVLAATMIILGVSAAPANAATWSKSTVYVENHAQNWPVYQAAKDVAGGSSLNLHVVSKCPKNSQCIKVYDVGYLSGPLVGQTWWWAIGDRFVGTTTIYLDNSQGRYYGWNKKATVVCHELGHAVGLRHTGNSRSCMHSPLERNPTPHLSSGERKTLDRWY